MAGTWLDMLMQMVSPDRRWDPRRKNIQRPFNEGPGGGTSGGGSTGGTPRKPPRNVHPGWRFDKDLPTTASEGLLVRRMSAPFMGLIGPNQTANPVLEPGGTRLPIFPPTIPSYLLPRLLPPGAPLFWPLQVSPWDFSNN